jgi:hypothetical protein
LQTGNLIAPIPLKPIRRQRGVPGRILDVAVTHIRLKRPRIDAVIRQLKAAGWRSMWACALMPSLAAAAARSTMREKPGADNGAPRSETNTKGDLGAFPLMPTQLA